MFYKSMKNKVVTAETIKLTFLISEIAPDSVVLSAPGSEVGALEGATVSAVLFPPVSITGEEVGKEVGESVGASVEFVLLGMSILGDIVMGAPGIIVGTGVIAAFIFGESVGGLVGILVGATGSVVSRP